jgi:hypothetical protein
MKSRSDAWPVGLAQVPVGNRRRKAGAAPKLQKGWR